MTNHFYDNGEPVTKDTMEEESWYGFYSSLIEKSMHPDYQFCAIDGPGKLVKLFNKEWHEFKDEYKDFPSEEQILRWAVLLTERHNNVFNNPKIIKAYREEYSDLKRSFKDWDGWDVLMYEIAVIEKGTGTKEFYKDVDVKGGLPKNKGWIYTDNELSRHVSAFIEGFVTLGILEERDGPQYRWKE